jgi:hypothetical protein
MKPETSSLEFAMEFFFSELVPNLPRGSSAVDKMGVSDSNSPLEEGIDLQVNQFQALQAQLRTAAARIIGTAGSGGADAMPTLNLWYLQYNL